MAGRTFLLAESGDQPLVAVALHDGHEVHPETAEALLLTSEERLREEDPGTAAWAKIASTRLIARRSRFEYDLNRPRDRAVYEGPAEAWGLDVWRKGLPSAVRVRALRNYDAFYTAARGLFTRMAERHGRFVVYDIHSYNHRRDGPGGAVADAEANPEVNVGTGSLNRARWGAVVDAFLADMGARGFDARENVKFLGGFFSRWTHRHFPESGCCLAIEFKKTFMDEWTGVADPAAVTRIHNALRDSVDAVLEALART